MSRFEKCWILILSAAIGSFWASGAFFSKRLQDVCNFKEPYLITYVNEAVLGLSCALMLCFLSKGSTAVQLTWRQVFCKSALLGFLAYIANLTFTAALGLTWVSSAMTLEQLTSVFIALGSYVVLKERYSLLQILGLCTAVSGAVVTVWESYAISRNIAPDPLVGDSLVLVTAFAAAAYMVLFKCNFHGSSLRDLFVILTAKSFCSCSVAWIGFFVAGNAPRLLQTRCVWFAFSAATASSVSFNIVLAWGTLVVSPLVARLSVLLGLPLGVVVDITQGANVTIGRTIGVGLVLLGVAIFNTTVHSMSTEGSEALLQEASTSNPRISSQPSLSLAVQAPQEPCAA